MSKRLKSIKPKDQRDLTELWQSNMRKDQDPTSSPNPQKASTAKKRTPPSTEQPEGKRSIKGQG